MELALIMGFLAFILLSMMIIAEFTSKNNKALSEIRYQMRVSMAQNAASPFSHAFKEEHVHVQVPGRMKDVFKTPTISQTQRIDYYEGSYHGEGINFYRTRGRFVRQIEIQD